jgi:hypothetical protein
MPRHGQGGLEAYILPNFRSIHTVAYSIRARHAEHGRRDAQKRGPHVHGLDGVRSDTPTH